MTEHLHRAFEHVLQCGPMGKQVEALEDHSHRPTLRCDFGLAQLMQRAVAQAITDRLISHPDLTLVRTVPGG